MPTASPRTFASLGKIVTARRDVQRPSPIRAAKPGGGPAAILRDDFGLTAAEARVAMALADGLDLEEIRARQGVGMATVRSHLKAIYRKTGVKGQVQLVVLVFKLMRSH